ncbi:hypothetical protein QQ045_030102 [Rhodiola kirilowii]
MGTRNCKTLIMTIVMLSSVLVIEAKVHVKVFNRSPLVMHEHCYSGNDDLDLHVLKTGEFHDFSFNPNIWGSTKFECAVSFGDHGAEKHLMAYRWKRDSSVCHPDCQMDVYETKYCRWNRLQNREECWNLY